MTTTASPTPIRHAAAGATENRVTLAAALGARKSFIYLYDFGDGWEHRVTVEKSCRPNPGLKLPQCLAEPTRARPRT